MGAGRGGSARPNQLSSAIENIWTVLEFSLIFRGKKIVTWADLIGFFKQYLETGSVYIRPLNCLVNIRAIDDVLVIRLLTVKKTFRLSIMRWSIADAGRTNLGF